MAVITETRLRQTLVVWDALFAAVLEEVVPVIDDEDLAEDVSTDAPVLLGERQPEDPQLAEAVPDVLRELLGLVPHPDELGRALASAEVPHHPLEVLLLVCQLEVDGCLRAVCGSARRRLLTGR